MYLQNIKIRYKIFLKRFSMVSAACVYPHKIFYLTIYYESPKSFYQSYFEKIHLYTLSTKEEVDIRVSRVERSEQPMLAHERDRMHCRRFSVIKRE